MRLHTPLLCTLLFSSVAAAQTALKPTVRFPLPEGPLTLRQPALPSHPFTVTGRSGAILGMQDGTTEVWQLPVKLFSGLHLRAEVEGYTVPIELNPLAAEIDVSPDHTTLTYSHAAITVKQHMFAPAGPGNEGLGGMMFFEIHCIHPATLTVSFTPSLIRMWPAPQWGTPGWGWRPLGSGGAYILASDNPEVFGMVAMPNATPGQISPYQEHPRTLPVEFRVHFDPARDADHFFPLFTELARPGERNNGAGVNALQSRLLQTAASLPEIYSRTLRFYNSFFENRTVVHTPDPQFDLALRWAELAIDKAQATTTSGETGLVAGWFPAFDSARPGFGWFFGRDTLWSMYAIDSYGDRELARHAFSFLLNRQRADGKMMHEYSQSADLLTGDMSWDKLPYEYAAADATPLFLLALEDYVRASGDLAFLREHWDAVERAYQFERTHDSDGDGVYDNAQGTGWVEDWPRMPHQELYLAALDRDATRATAVLARWTGHDALAAEADTRAAALNTAVNAYRLPNNLFAFSKNPDGSYDPTLTVYPSVALWSSAAGFSAPEYALQSWAGHAFATDWGTRAIADTDKTYDPISYHRGTVWPLFTGWTSMAEYRGGHPLAGYAALRRNLDLTWAQDPGSVTELLSGAFYQPLGRSSTHQLWSSAMVLAPALRGLFGLEPDATTHTILVHPHLPPSWRQVSLDHVRLGADDFNIIERRAGSSLEVLATSSAPSVLCLLNAPDLTTTPPACKQSPSTTHRLTLSLPALEFELPIAPPYPGAETTSPHVIAEHTGDREADLTLEAPAGTIVVLRLQRNGPAARSPHTPDGTLRDDTLQVTMPSGSGWTQKRVTVSW